MRATLAIACAIAISILPSPLARGQEGGRGVSYAYGNGHGPRRADLPGVRISGPIQITGPLPMAAVRRELHRQLPRVQYCYEAHVLVQTPDLGGTVTVHFLVQAATGAVIASAPVSSTFENHEVGDCVAGAMRTSTFPAATVLVNVEVTFELSPHGFRSPVHRDTRGGAQ